MKKKGSNRRKIQNDDDYYEEDYKAPATKAPAMVY